MDHARLLSRTREEQEEMSYYVNKGPDGRLVAFRPRGVVAYRQPCESATGWTASLGTIAASTDYFQCGLASLKAARASSWATGYKGSLGPWDLSDGTYNLFVRFYIPAHTDGTPMADNVSFGVGEAGATNTLYMADSSMSPGWNVFDSPIPRPADFPTAHGSWMKAAGYAGTAVDTIVYSCQTLQATGAMYIDEFVIYQNTATVAKVVWTLDDFGSTSTTTMAYILERHGWRGTFSCIASSMTAAQWELARNLERRGHLVACHSLVDTPRYDAITAGDMRSNIISAQKIMRSQGCTRGSRILVLPGGQWGTTGDHRDVLQQQCDCVIAVSDVKSFENTAYVDKSNRANLWNPNPPYDKRTWSRGLLGDTALTQANIDRLIAVKGFEPIIQHSLGGSYLSQADFESRCAYIAAAEAAGTIEVSTVEKEVYG